MSSHVDNVHDFLTRKVAEYRSIADQDEHPQCRALALRVVQIQSAVLAIHRPSVTGPQGPECLGCGVDVYEAAIGIDDCPVLSEIAATYLEQPQ